MKLFVNLILFICLISAQNIFAEKINNYQVDLVVNKDATVNVTETIVYDFESAKKHGIFRFIPVNFEIKGQEKMSGLQERKLEFKIDSISNSFIDE